MSSSLTSWAFFLCLWALLPRRFLQALFVPRISRRRKRDRRVSQCRRTRTRLSKTKSRLRPRRARLTKRSSFPRTVTPTESGATGRRERPIIFEENRCPTLIERTQKLFASDIKRPQKEEPPTLAEKNVTQKD